MKLSTLKQYDRNPRTIAADALIRLQESIKRDPEFMRLRPIVHLPEGTIIGGNQRWRACIGLGMDDVPDEWCRNVGDMPEEQWKRFVLVDNGPDGMTGTYDMDIISSDYSQEFLESIGIAMAMADPGGGQIDDFLGNGSEKIKVALTFETIDDRDNWMNAIDWKKVNCKREVKP